MAIPRVVAVYTQDIDSFWPILKPLIDKALKHSFGTLSCELIHEELTSGDCQAFLVMDEKVVGAFVTTIMNFPQRRALHVPIVAGERMDEWLEQMVEMTQRFAKLNGCDVVTGCGRRGWVQKLKRYGWEEEMVTISVEVK